MYRISDRWGSMERDATADEFRGQRFEVTSGTECGETCSTTVTGPAGDSQATGSPGTAARPHASGATDQGARAPLVAPAVNANRVDGMRHHMLYNALQAVPASH